MPIVQVTSLIFYWCADFYQMIKKMIIMSPFIYDFEHCRCRESSPYETFSYFFIFISIQTCKINLHVNICAVWITVKSIV